MIWETTTSSPEETRRLGKLIGSTVTRATVVFLCGDLGAGKTCLTQGIGEALAGDQEIFVTSPSYTLMNLYPGRLNLYHFDLYRLSGMDELYDIGFEEYLQEDGVIVVEWADRIENWEGDALSIHLLHEDETKRKLVFEAHGEECAGLLNRFAVLWSEGRNAHG